AASMSRPPPPSTPFPYTTLFRSIQGNGWGVLAWDPVGQRLITQQLRDHHNNMSLTTVPLLVFDIWEHAYYLQYKNVKADYVKNLWNVVNWAEVSRRFEEARAGRQP